MNRTPIDDQAMAQIFTEARTFNSWSDTPVADDVLEEVYRLTALGPTTANSSPARFVFIRTAAGRERLRPHLSAGNLDKTMSAPCCVIVARDTRFHDHMPQLFPSRDFRSIFEGDPAAADDASHRSSTLEGAYLIIAARALGLDAGPMSGFNKAGVDAEFLPDGRWKSNFLCNLGYGTGTALFPRNPRLRFDQACVML